MAKNRRLAGYFFRAELLFSDSYMDLPKSGRDLLHCLVFELKFVKNKRKG